MLLESARLSKLFVVWLLVITAVAAGLRMYDLAGPSLWADEVYTVRSAATLENGVSKVFGYVPTAATLRAFGIPMDQVSMDNVHEWQSLGISHWRIRLASAIIGILTIPLVALIGRRVFGDRAAVIIALLLAVAPWHLWMSQVGRFYSQQFLFGALCLIWYVHATAHGSKRSMALAMVCLVLAFHSQPPVLAIVGVFAVDWLSSIARRQPVRLGGFGWAAAVIGLVICAGSFAVDGLFEAERWEQFESDRTSDRFILTLGPIWMIGPVTVAFAAFGAMMIWKERPRQAMYWSLAAVVPMASLIVISFLTYVHFRYMFVCLLGWLVLAGLGADRMYLAARNRYGMLASHGALAMLIASAMLMNYSYFTDGFGFRDRWQDAFDYVQQHREPGERIVSGTKALYYLEEPDIIRMHHVDEPSDLLTIDRPLWLVYRAESPATPRQYRWLAGHAELKATFDRRVQEPFSSIRVYYFDPQRHGSELTEKSSGLTSNERAQNE